MRERSLKRYALFLIVVILVQDFAHLKYISRPVQLQLKDKSNSENAISEVHHGKSREKRWVTVALITLAVLATTATITTEIILAIEGCCLPNPKACEYQEEFERINETLATEIDVIDQMWEDSQIKYIWIEYTNLANEGLWNQIDRLVGILRSLIDDVTPGTATELDIANNDMQDQIDAGNQTVINWSLSELSTAYNTYFTGDWKYITLRLSGFLLLGGELVFVVARNRYKTNAFRNFLSNNQAQLSALKDDSKAIKLLGEPADLLDEAAAVKRSAISFKTTFDKIRIATNWIITIGLIGIEIWLTIEKFKQCDDIEDELKKARDGIREDEVVIAELKQNVTEYYDGLITIYDENVKGQLTADYVMELLGDIKNLTENAAQNDETINATTTLADFMSNIGDADESTTYDMVSALITSLKGVDYTFECFEKKTGSIRKIRLRCESGDDDLLDIFNEVMEEDDTNGNCVSDAGLPYTEFDDVEYTIEAYAEQLGFNIDCKLNDPSLLTHVCEDKCSLKTDDVIMSENDINQSQLDTLVPQCPADCPLETTDFCEICTLRASGYDYSLVQLLKGGSFTEGQLQSAWDDCVTSECTDSCTLCP